MNAQHRERSIRKILVALDSSIHSTAALEASVELAARLEAELTGLFIEDVNLFRLAEFPFAREISFFSPTLRRIDLADLQRQVRAQANRMRSLLSAYATRAGIAWDFRIVRGTVTAEVMTAAAEADLIVLGKRGRSLIRKVGSTTRFFIAEGRGMMLILEHGYRMDMPVTVFYDGGPLSEKALEAAVHLVKIKDGRLTVFILAAEAEAAQKVQMAAMKHLDVHGLAANFRVVFYPTAPRLRHLIRLEGEGPVVLPLMDGPFQGLELGNLISDMPNPVLLVR